MTYMYCTVGTQEHEDGPKEADHERSPLTREVAQVQPKAEDLMRVLIISKNKQWQQDGKVSDYVEDQYETLELR